jgi:hypothetical protein
LKTVLRDKMAIVPYHNDKLRYLVLRCYVIVMSLFKSEVLAQSQAPGFRERSDAS